MVSHMLKSLLKQHKKVKQAIIWSTAAESPPQRTIQQQRRLPHIPQEKALTVNDKNHGWLDIQANPFMSYKSS